MLVQKDFVATLNSINVTFLKVKKPNVMSTFQKQSWFLKIQGITKL